MRWGMRRSAMAGAALLSALACSEHRTARGAEGGGRDPVSTGGRLDAGHDAGPSCEGDAQAEPIRELDLLFVIDSSITMADDQARLARRLPVLLQRLAPAQSGRTLRLGVVSSDLGSPPSWHDERCDLLGDDGLLQREGNATLEGELERCSERTTPFLAHEAGRDEIEKTASELSCLVQLGNGGCGFEKQLEATLRALWPAKGEREPIGGPASGHGDGANAGFLEPESEAMLAVIAMSVEDDCSHADGHFLLPFAELDGDDPADARLLTQGLNTRCALNPDALYPVERYVDAWRALRGGHAERVFFAAIAGAPPAAVDGVLTATDFDDAADRERFYGKLLARPEMQIVIDTTGSDDPGDDAVWPSCGSTGGGAAYPPVRYTELARAFGGYGLIQSICHDDYTAAVDAIGARIDQLMAKPGCR